MENRKFKRFHNSLEVKYEILKTPNWEEASGNYLGQTTMENISNNGILFIHEVPLPIGSFLEIEIKIPSNDYPINLTGKIVRVEEITEDVEYEIGFVFQNIFEKDKELLIEYLQEIGSK